MVYVKTSCYAYTLFFLIFYMTCTQYSLGFFLSAFILPILTLSSLTTIVLESVLDQAKVCHEEIPWLPYFSSFTTFCISKRTWKWWCLFRQPQMVSLFADGHIGWGQWWGGWVSAGCWRTRAQERRVSHSGAPPPRTHWIREPPVSLCNLMAVDIIEDWMRKMREKGVVDRVKRMMREWFILTWHRWKACGRPRS